MSSTPTPRHDTASGQAVRNATDSTSPTSGAHDAFARIACLLGAQRVEIFLTCDDETVLVGQWAALGQAPHPYEDGHHSEPGGWFPWSLGNVRPTEYLFVRNAAALPLAPHDPHGSDSASSSTIGNLGLESALYLPVLVPANQLGAVCAYWSSECATWPVDSGSKVSDWASDVLARLR